MVIHIAGPEQADGGQRCATCPFVLIEPGDNLGFWTPGQFIAVTGWEGLNRRMRVIKDATAAKDKGHWCSPETDVLTAAVQIGGETAEPLEAAPAQ